MTHINKLFIGIMLFSAVAFAQETKIAAVDFERVVVGSVEGKKAQDAWNAKYAERQKSLEAQQKAIEDAQNKLKTQGNVLSETVKAEIGRDIEKRSTDLTRVTEDAQKELEELRSSLLRPISETAQRILQEYASEKGYTLVIDVSNPAANIVYANPRADISEEIIKRIDSAASRPAPAATAPAAPRPPAAPAPK